MVIEEPCKSGKNLLPNRFSPPQVPPFIGSRAIKNGTASNILAQFRFFVLVYLFSAYQFGYGFERGVFGVFKQHKQDRFGAGNGTACVTEQRKRSVQIRCFAGAYGIGGNKDLKTGIERIQRSLSYANVGFDPRNDHDRAFAYIHKFRKSVFAEAGKTGFSNYRCIFGEKFRQFWNGIAQALRILFGNSDRHLEFAHAFDQHLSTVEHLFRIIHSRQQSGLNIHNNEN